MKRSVFITLFSLQLLTLLGIATIAYYTYTNKVQIGVTQHKLSSTFTFMDKMAEMEKQEEEKRKPITVGSQAPDFSLQNEEGKKVKLEDFKGQKTLLVFSHPSCNHCQDFYPVLNSFQEKQKNVKIVLMHLESTPEQNKIYKSKQGIKVTMLAATIKQAQDYKVRNTPTTILLDQKGRVLGTGSVTRLQELEKFVKENA